MAADANMDVDMDIDIDLTYEDPEIARLQAEAAAIGARAAENTDTMNGVEQAPEEGEVNLDDPVPTKVHVRGVDNLTTNDIKNFAAEHYSTDLFSGKVQWIDDTSANLIYDTEVAAEEALMALSAEEVTDLQQLRLAKSLSTHPDTILSVRQAKVSDVKEPGAKDRSRFYLMNPDYDPDNRPRRRAQGQRGGRGGRGYQRSRRDYEDDRNVRRNSQGDRSFDVNLYDDNPAPSGTRGERRDSYSSASESGGRRKVRYEGGEDLFSAKANGRLRDRSASPLRDGDGRYGFDDDQPRRQTARHRSRTPPRRRGKDNFEARDNLRKELFPGKTNSTTSALSNGQSNGNGTDLFPNRAASPMDTKELFPEKASPNHRRKGARELDANDVATAIGGPPPKDDLFSRMSGGPQGESTYGRLQQSNGNQGFSFKGAGQAPGFSILGASKERVENPLVKELFPLKANKPENGSKDLFDGRVKGRGQQRRRAEDLI